ncbi:MAG: hypothetical protein [Podoviridae sp. cty5g4]|nr:MAG: hypothetical protein [Podoviridae sp. cty5g4]
MANAAPNSYKVMLHKGQITGLSDTFKIILMAPGFVFNKDSHFSYADVIAYELSTGNGYTAGGQTLTGVAIARNDTDDRSDMTWSNAQWTASGGTLVTSGAIVYDDSTSTGSGDDYTDAIVAYRDGNGNLTAVDGTPITVANIKDTIS